MPDLDKDYLEPHSDSESVFLDGPTYKAKKPKTIFLAGNYYGQPGVIDDYMKVIEKIIPTHDKHIDPCMLPPGMDKSFYLFMAMDMIKEADEIYVVHHDGAEPYIAVAKALGKKISYFTND